MPRSAATGSPPRGFSPLNPGASRHNEGVDDESNSRKVWILAGLAIVLVLAAGVWLGRPAYRHFQERRSLAQARAFLEKGDQRAGVLALRQTLAYNPGNVEATRLMAGLAGEAQSPMALALWQRVVELSPTIENRIMLAAISLRVEQPPFPVAAQMVEDLRAPGETNVSYQFVASQLAIKLNRAAEAAAHLEIASRLEPTNRLHQLNLATLRLRSGDPAVASAARGELTALVPDASVGEQALRSLTAEALLAHRPAEALEFSRQLLTRPQATFADQLQHLTVLQEAKSGELPAALARVRQVAGTNAANLSQTAIWMTGHDRAKEALDWLAGLPPDLRNAMPIPIVEADCLVVLRDWPALEKRLQEQKWKDFDFLRYAYRSLAAEKTGGGVGVEGHWRSAMREAGERLGALSTLLTLADKWNRPLAREELLWRIGNRFPGEKWAYRELGRAYLAAGNTRGLHKLYGAMFNSNPSDLVLKNNFAATSLLLKLNLPQAHQYAREIFAAAPHDPVPVSTYAFSLYVQGKTSAALAELQKLDPAALEKQPVALYQGLLLWAVGRTNEATRFLDIAAKSPDLLPEEKALLAECQRSTGPR